MLHNPSADILRISQLRAIPVFMQSVFVATGAHTSSVRGILSEKPLLEVWWALSKGCSMDEA